MSTHAVYDWLHRHPLLVDTVIAGLLFLVLGATAAVGAGMPELLLGLLLIAPLALRRRYPFGVALVVAGGCLMQVVVIDVPLPADVAVLFAIYAVAAWSQQRWKQAAVLVLGLFGAGLAAVDWMVNATGQADVLGVGFAFVSLGLVVVVAWVFGDLMRSRRAVVGRLREQNEALARERDQRGRLAAQEERSRIAREMHDIVAHSLSVVVVQADGGAYAARSALESGSVSAEALGRTAATLETVASTARSALADTRRLVGVLREQGDTAEYAPQEGLEQLDALVGRVRDAGVPVGLDVRGYLGGLPHGVDLAAYRVVQESLTNVLKHAGPAARARVDVHVVPGALHLRVLDDGRGASVDSDGGGHGILGMTERVAVHGGLLQAGPQPGGGFGVVAMIPTDVDIPASPQVPITKGRA